MLSTGHGRKNDDADATSVAMAAQSAAGLRTVTVDEAVTALRALVEHRDDVVKTRTQTVNRLHALLTQLLPAGAPRRLTADTATQLLRPVRPRSIAARTLRRLAAESITEIRDLDRRISVANTEITHAVQVSRSTLTELRGIGHLNAGKILARVGDVHRFRSAAAFASYTGTAPIEVSSGDVVRHRLSPAPGTASSTAACTPWPSPNSNATARAAPTTCANEPTGRATKKPCAASSGDYPTWSTDA